MYAKTVYVNFRNKLRQVMVPCSPETPMETLKERAINKLKKLEQKYKNDFEWAYEGMKKGYNV